MLPTGGLDAVGSPDSPVNFSRDVLGDSPEQRCNTLNLGVEFFLLFTHQVQALLSFLFPLRSFFPISKQYSDWCPLLELALRCKVIQWGV
jgi:hypothetical protein